MDEFPSMYSPPLLSRSTAPCPSTRTSGSCSGAHHSRMSVNGCQTNCLSAAVNSSVFHSVMNVCESFRKFQIPIPKSQGKFNSQIPKRRTSHPLFEIIDEKIRVNSRASDAKVSPAARLFLDKPVSTNRKNRRLSLGSFRQIFTRIRKSFLPRASSASIQLAATEPDARTN